MSSLISLNLDWVALCIGTLGTVLWAHNGKSASYAGVLWFVSAMIWIAYAYLNRLPALGSRDIINVLLYIYGAYRGLSKKKSPSE